MDTAGRHDRPGRTTSSRWRVLLAPFSLSYGTIIGFRNLFYDLHLFKAKRLDRPAVAIGNITTGGTGKTPLTQAIANHIIERGKNPAILSRGYRSDSEGSGRVFKASHEYPQPSKQVGDEAAMLARKLPGVWFGIGADRVESSKAILTQAGVDCFVLDDAFQHRKVQRDLNIVVIDASNPIGNGMLLPAGVLREPLSSLQRSDVIMLSRCEMAGSGELERLEARLRKYCLGVPIIRGKTIVTGLRSLDSKEKVLKADSRIWALAGIANPAGFWHTLTAHGFDVCGETWFPDHHSYRPGDLEKVAKNALAAGAVGIVTTEKDAVKLAPEYFSNLECHVLEIGIDFGAQADIFWGIIDEVVQC